MNKKHIIKTFETKKTREWDTLYWAVDIHDTCVKANYSKDTLPTEFFSGAKEVLQRISNRKDCCLILYTCSHPPEIEQYLELFKSNGINFKYVNKNPEPKDTAFGCFKDKFYFNLMLDDKAGFNANTDWSEISEALDEVEYYETHTPEQVKSHKRLAKMYNWFFPLLLFAVIGILFVVGYYAGTLAMIIASIICVGGLFYSAFYIQEKSPARFHITYTK